MTKLRYALALLLIVAAPVLAQNTATPSGTRVQGTPDGKGDPVQVTIVGPDGADTTSTTSVMVRGGVASGATDSGNPVKVGGIYNSTPITLTNGQRGDLQLGSRGSARVELFSASGAGSLGITGSNADAAPTSSSAGVLGLNLVFNGTTVDRMRGDTNATSVSTTGLSGTYWRYTSGTSPILSNTTTAVTIKAASGASVKTYLDSCEIGSTALGASVPFAFRDGAAGTVMFAVRPPTAGWLTPFVVHFSPPLVGTANTLMEVVTTTADTSGTFDVNCQGHTGS